MAVYSPIVCARCFGNNDGKPLNDDELCDQCAKRVGTIVKVTRWFWWLVFVVGIAVALIYLGWRM